MGRGISQLQREILLAAGRNRLAATKDYEDVSAWAIFVEIPLPKDVYRELYWTIRTAADRVARYSSPYYDKFRPNLWLRMMTAVVEGDEEYGVEPIGETTAKVVEREQERINAVWMADGADSLFWTFDPDGIRWEPREAWSAFVKLEETETAAAAVVDKHRAKIESLFPGATIEISPPGDRRRPDLLVADVVMMAGNGTRTPTAEAVASKSIARLKARGLVWTGRADLKTGQPKALFLTDKGRAAIAEELDVPGWSSPEPVTEAEAAAAIDRLRALVETF